MHLPGGRQPAGGRRHRRRPDRRPRPSSIWRAICSTRPRPAPPSRPPPPPPTRPAARSPSPCPTPSSSPAGAPNCWPSSRPRPTSSWPMRANWPPCSRPTTSTPPPPSWPPWSRSPPSRAASRGLGDRLGRRTGRGRRLSRSTRSSTPPVPATSTPPASCWASRAACRWNEAGQLGSLAASEVIAHWGPRPMTSLEALAKEAGLSPHPRLIVTYSAPSPPWWRAAGAKPDTTPRRAGPCQPLMDRGPDHAGAAASALTGDHQHRAIAARLRPHQEGGQGVLGLEPAIAVQVDPRLDRIALARQSPLAARLQFLGRAAGGGRARTRWRQSDGTGRGASLAACRSGWGAAGGSGWTGPDDDARGLLRLSAASPTRRRGPRCGGRRGSDQVVRRAHVVPEAVPSASSSEPGSCGPGS